MGGLWQRSSSFCVNHSSDTCSSVQGNINLIEAALKKGVKKFVLVTSIGWVSRFGSHCSVGGIRYQSQG